MNRNRRTSWKPKDARIYVLTHSLYLCNNKNIISFVLFAFDKTECSFSGSYFSSYFFFLSDEKPTVVGDGHLLCAAPTLYEIGQ